MASRLGLTAEQRARKFIAAELERNAQEPLECRKKIFKELQRECHPDKNLQDPQVAKQVFQFLMEQRGPFLLP